MPELLTHAAVGYLAARAAGATRLPALDPLLVVAGSCLPDWLSHASLAWFDWIGMLHEPPAALAASALLGSFARPGRRGLAARSWALGASLHYALDLGQTHAFPVYSPLFPFHTRVVGFSCWGIEASLAVAPLLALLAALLLLRERRRRRISR